MTQAASCGTGRSRRRVGSSSTRGWAAADAWERTKELAQLTEQLGYHHLWVYDHVETVPRREPTHMFEAFTMLAALAQHTSTIKLGQMVTCAAYRNAGLLAKEAACVDVFSGGRLILGIGAGWYEREYQAYGFPFPSAGHAPRRSSKRRSRSSSGSGPRRPSRSRASTSRSTARTATRSRCSSCPEIWIGGGGEKVTLRIEARHADKTNWQTGIEGFVRKSELLAQYCDEIGRDFDSIVRTHGPDCRVFDTEADMQQWLDSPGGGSLWGRATARRVRARQLRRHGRAGRGEGAGVRRRGVPASSCCGSATSRRRESLEAFARDVDPARPRLIIGSSRAGRGDARCYLLHP